MPLIAPLIAPIVGLVARGGATAAAGAASGGGGAAAAGGAAKFGGSALRTAAIASALSHNERGPGHSGDALEDATNAYSAMLQGGQFG